VDVPGSKFADVYGELACENMAKLRQELSISKLSQDGGPGDLEGNAANKAKKARAATTRVKTRK
jgi:hypothetical protein